MMVRVIGGWCAIPRGRQSTGRPRCKTETHLCLHLRSAPLSSTAKYRGDSMINRRAYFAAAMSGALLAAASEAWAKDAVRAAPPTALAPAASPESVGFDSARLAKLDAAMAKVVADGRVAGMTTLLARHGKVVEFKT